MILIGCRHYVKHGVDLLTVLPVLLGFFGLYMVLFNHRLLGSVQDFIIKAWFPVGQLITVLLLAVTYYLIFAPVGLLLRLFKKDILNRKLVPNALTYWVERSTNEKKNYTQQF
jgi:hypothetical protein